VDAPAPDALISPEYRALLRSCHVADARWGSTAGRWAGMVRNALSNLPHGATVLDYGCGKGELARALDDVEVREYDPAIPGKDDLPEPADLVVCVDVLEHVEPDRLYEVLAHIASLARRRALLAVATRAAVKELSDGRNAHLIVHPHTWWEDQLLEHFRLEYVHVKNRGEFVALAAPEPK